MLLRCLALVPLCISITSCSSSANRIPAGRVFAGSVKGGQQPIVGSTIQLWSAGLQGGSSSQLQAQTATDSAGNFSITGQYTCTTGEFVYLIALGGDTSGDGGKTSNADITELVLLGDCETLLQNAQTTFIDLNEVTTVAAVNAVSNYGGTITYRQNISGSSYSNLYSAYNDQNSNVNIASGQAIGSNALTVNTLANVVAACINTTSANSSSCYQLGAVTTGSSTDTMDALFWIFQNPTANIGSIFSLQTPASPFLPGLSNPPSTWQF